MHLMHAYMEKTFTAEYNFTGAFYRSKSNSLEVVIIPITSNKRIIT